MGEREKVLDKIRKKQVEIQELESSIKDAKVYLQALEDVLRLFPREADIGDGALLRPGSLVAQARDAILKHGAPMHVTALVKALGRELTRANQTGIAGSIAAYVRKGEIFTRAGPNTFGLVELAKAAPTEVEATDEPPADFGQDLAAAPEPEPEPEPEPKTKGEDFDDDIPF
jgi:hypothetical protein